MKIQEKIKKNIPLAPFTTYNIGGPAKFFVELKTKEEFQEALKWAEEHKEKVYIIGGGSNILVNDDGVNGLVLKMNNTEVKVMVNRIEAGSGATLSRVNSLARNQNLSGFEWSVGIPRATVGGSVRGNAGAFGTECVDLIETVEVYNKKRNCFEILSNTMCNFSYRNSIFKKDNNYVIWLVTFKLTKDVKENIDAKIDKSITFRRNRYPQLPSAGSVFKNIEVEVIKQVNPVFFEKEIKDRIGQKRKVSAGLVIDLAGFKGKTCGGIKVSLEHANHIVNTGNGTAKEVKTLVKKIKNKVFSLFKIELKEEITYLGF